VELVVAENHSIVQEKEERVNFIQRPWLSHSAHLPGGGWA